MIYEDTWPQYLRWLQRLIWPHGFRCLWRCSPWHRCAPTYAEWKANRDRPA